MGLLDTLSEFISPEAGQRRRAALNRVDQRINDALGYYLGPQLAPRVQKAANLGGLLSPGQDVVDAYQASGEMMAPDRGLIDRAASGAALAGALGAMFMPGGVSSIRQGVEDVADAAVRAYDPNTTNAFTVWHGSPHDFDRFSLDKIGTGEGAQAYGHGLYFAENPDVAAFYRDNYAKPDGALFSTGSARQMAQDQLQAWAGDIQGGIEDLKASLRNMETTARFFGADEGDAARMQDLREAISYMEAGAPRGRLYEVSIDANPEDFLDWDLPLAGQARNIQDVIRSANPTAPGMARGSELYEAIAKTRTPRETGKVRLGAADTSALLREAGIPGIRYLDAGSRGAGDGSRNYVLFDDSLATIVGKDGQYTPAQQIARLLREGRGSEVTDDLYAQADPQELSRLYDAGATGMDMPMGPAALERADAMGLDTDAYHATRSTENFDQFRPGWRGSTYFAATPQDAASGALGGAQDASQLAQQINGPAMTATIPVRLPGDEVARLRPSRSQWDALPNEAFVHNEADLAKSVGGRYPDDVFDTALTDSGDVRITRRPYPQQEYTRDSVSWTGERLPGWNEGSDAEALRRVADRFGQRGFLVSDEAGASIVAGPDMPIRSRFARFDPRLSHLRNLSAGLAGAGALGLGLLSMPPSQAETEQYLAERGLLQ